MKIDRAMRVAVVVLLIAISAAAAAHGTVEDCKLLINKLITNTRSVAIHGRNVKKDRAELIANLEVALTDLDTVKPCTAVQKLNDFKIKVNQLIAAKRINTDENAGTTSKDLIDDADAAIKCIDTESAGCGT